MEAKTWTRDAAAGCHLEIRRTMKQMNVYSDIFTYTYFTRTRVGEVSFGGCTILIPIKEFPAGHYFQTIHIKEHMGRVEMVFHGDNSIAFESFKVCLVDRDTDW
jgi:hypothetical protein